jgi:GT2 family glycosyltransferase
MTLRAEAAQRSAAPPSCEEPAMIEGRPRIALVVATYRRPEALDVLLASVERQTLPRGDFEVAVVVDGLDEHREPYQRRLEAARAAGLPLAFAFQENAGQSAARNRAARMTTAPLLCIVDDDMDLAPGFLAAHVEALADPDTVSIGCVIPEDGWERQPLYEAVRTKAMLELHAAMARAGGAARAAAFVTQNVALPRRAFDAAGGFDETLKLGEDTAMGLRLEFAGARFVFAERAAAVHRSRVGSFDTWLRRQVQYGRNCVYLWEQLARDPRAHYLRNLVNGSRLNAAVVHACCWSDLVGAASIASLRWLGQGLQGVGLFAPAIATHKAILALAYHTGVRHALGSWRGVLREEWSFARTPGRPASPT